MNGLSLLQARRQAWVVMLVGAAAAAFAGLHNAQQFFQSYFFAYALFFGLTSGSLGFTLLYILVGGAWGRSARGVFRSVSRLMPWMALLFIPVLLGMQHIYPWTHPEYWTEGPALNHKHVYFYLPFYIGRAIFYFAIWSFMAWRGARITDAEIDRQGGPPHAFGSIGLLTYVLTLSFAAFDWIMSLEPHWSSSIYGGLIIMGHCVGALSFAILLITWLSRRYGPAFKPTADTAHDLGNLLLAFCILWTYMTLSQYLIIWCGNIPDEISWYLPRSHHGWRVLTTALILGQFAIPVALLLGRERKRDLSRLVRVAIFILTVRLIDVFYLIKPEFSRVYFDIHWLDLFALLAIGGFWFAMVCRGLEQEVRA